MIEVAAADRVGLLYAITRVLHDLRLDIHLAKVDTFGHEVADAFYVLRENGQKIPLVQPTPVGLFWTAAAFAAGATFPALA